LRQLRTLKNGYFHINTLELGTTLLPAGSEDNLHKAKFS
jgi:hypothetical protein